MSRCTSMIIALSFCMAACQPALVQAQVAADTVAADTDPSTTIVKAFATLCVQTMPDLQTVDALAAERGWTRLSAADSKSFAVPSADALSTTWRVARFAAVPFWLTTTYGTRNGKKVTACTLVSAGVPAAAIKTSLVATLDLKAPFRIDDEGDQHYTFWQTHQAGTSIILTLTEAPPAAGKSVNLSATLIETIPH